MTTRTGTSYEPMSNPNNEDHPPNQPNPMLAMLDEMRASLNNINTRLENLGHTPLQTILPILPRGDESQSK